MDLAALFTGGKDSTYAIYLAQQQGHNVVCLITLKSKNSASYMFHTPAIDLTELQAEALELPLINADTKGVKEKELLDLEKAIVKAKKKFPFEGIITGALFSEYQSSRIEKIAWKLDLKVISPLWHKEQEKEIEELLEKKFQFIMTSIAAEDLDKSWLNRVITQKDLERLKQLQKKFKINIAGEGGEYESLVLDCPLFKKRLVIETVKVEEEHENTARLIINKAKLVKK